MARYLGLGYPGGPAIDRARHARATRRPSRFPRPMLDDGPRLLLQRPEDGGRQLRPQAPRRRRPPTWPPRSRRPWSTCSSTKARRAAREVGRQGPRPRRRRRRQLAAAGAAPRRLRRRTASTAFLPSRAMCTDNAAMIAAAGWYRLAQRRPVPARHRRQPQPPPRPDASAPAARRSSGSAAPQRAERIVERSDPEHGRAQRARRRRLSTLGARLLTAGQRLSLALATFEC